MAPAASPSNPYKRQIDAVQRVYDCAKRLKTNHESSDSATSTVSLEPKTLSTSAPEVTKGSSDHESDDESWVSESSEEPSEESSEEDSSEAQDDDEREMDEEGVQQDAEEVVNLRANRGKRPDFKLPGDEELDDIRPFLKDFLPKLKAANEELEAQKKAGTLQSSEIIGDEEADGEEQYIEMNLGLGVLEEQGDEADNDAHESLDNNKEGEEEQQDSEKDVLGKLMGREKPKEPVGIQEVTDVQGNT
ncbi:uncharacterized protein N0V89_004653 [Didymosphaeria variabile]|uniref:Uncharacterized protein n=1 Tax=Didymosphaeria variabile TaxID=1932322 RepID=A0A9W8XQT1_9PLEO|nr:uncharacterized protein N0V89_004653 [Didymosphaeria variabile]KAJ4356617.1 hypothetical protein N0V89_004653 [Didymosphaeria variabile]